MAPVNMVTGKRLFPSGVEIRARDSSIDFRKNGCSSENMEVRPGRDLFTPGRRRLARATAS